MTTDAWPEILLDGAAWRTEDDFYEGFFAAVGAPDWHGRNFDALNDSIGTGDINRIETPYRLRVVGCDAMGPRARRVVDRFADLIRELSADGVRVRILCEA